MHLKWVAVVTMLIDHIGSVFFPQMAFLRIIGRFSFPIFAYQIAVGYRYTSNIKNYALRLSLFGLISQWPYNLLYDGLNIFFTLLCGLMVIYIYEKVDRLLSICLIVLTVMVPLDYGVYGVVSIFLFHVFMDKKKSMAGVQIITTGVYCLFNNPLQLFSILSQLLISFWKNTPKKKSNMFVKYFYYAFYPSHLLILHLIFYFLF